MSDGPRVSVVIPTRLRPALVPRAVCSALAQALTDIEVVVVIDGPDPDTREVLAAIADPRLRIVSSWSGPAAHRRPATSGWTTPGRRGRRCSTTTTSGCRSPVLDVIYGFVGFKVPTLPSPPGPPPALAPVPTAPDEPA